MSCCWTWHDHSVATQLADETLFPLVLKRSWEQLLVDTRSCPSPLRVPSLRVCDSIRVLVLLCLLGKLWLYLAQQTGVCWFSVDALCGSVLQNMFISLCDVLVFYLSMSAWLLKQEPLFSVSKTCHTGSEESSFTCGRYQSRPPREGGRVRTFFPVTRCLWHMGVLWT